VRASLSFFVLQRHHINLYACQKNVYSVFRYSPASVGFATLSSTALAMNGAGGAIPSATIGAVTATVTAGTRHSSDAVTSSSSWGGLCGVGVMAVLAMLGTLLV
jgi:cathepsin D